LCGATAPNPHSYSHTSTHTHTRFCLTLALAHCSTNTLALTLTLIRALTLTLTLTLPYRMRVAALPQFKKLYRIIREDILPGQYDFVIQARTCIAAVPFWWRACVRGEASASAADPEPFLLILFGPVLSLALAVG
jgi:hypothetical protein